MKNLAVLMVLSLATTAMGAGRPYGVTPALGQPAFGQLSPAPMPDAAYSGPVVAVPSPAPMMAAPMVQYQAVGLYQNVRVKDTRNIAPCAVSKVVQVPDPCNPGCCVNVEICVPGCACESVKVSKCGTKVKYDYGKYEVEITSRRGQVVVDYDD